MIGSDYKKYERRKILQSVEELPVLMLWKPVLECKLDNAP